MPTAPPTQPSSAQRYSRLVRVLQAILANNISWDREIPHVVYTRQESLSTPRFILAILFCAPAPEKLVDDIVQEIKQVDRTWVTLLESPMQDTISTLVRSLNENPAIGQQLAQWAQVWMDGFIHPSKSDKSLKALADLDGLLVQARGGRSRALHCRSYSEEQRMFKKAEREQDKLREAVSSSPSSINSVY